MNSNLGKKQTREAIRLLEEGIRSAMFKNADFTEEEKEKMRLYMTSWVVTPMQRVRNILNGYDEWDEEEYMKREEVLCLRKDKQTCLRE